MNRLGVIAAFLSAAICAGPVCASTFVEVTKTCPVGGGKFKFPEQMSSTSWGTLPDGMTLGTGPNPYRLPQCPKNGLVMYRDFDRATIARLAPIIASAEYQSARVTETPYYLAYWLATKLGDEDRAWLLLAAGWEAKNADPVSPRALRYADEFVTLVATMPVNDRAFESIALRARAANALRERGHFAAAEALRASIKIAPDAGGTAANAVDNRTGWTTFLASLAAPIAREDTSRAPIDMIGEREAAARCVEPEEKPNPSRLAAAPLSAFEQSYCARPELAESIAQIRKWRRNE